MKKPSARDYFLSEQMPQFFSSRTYEEYIVETTRRLGRLKKDLSPESLEYYAKNSLATLRFSNSIEINHVYEGLCETAPGIKNFLETCFVAVTPETPINAFAYYKDRAYTGHIIEMKAGIVNWFAFFLAPFVTLSWLLDEETPRQDRNSLVELFEKQKAALEVLKVCRSEAREINKKLERPWFPREEMWLEYTYFKNAAFAFVVLHELGHHALKHTASESSGLFEAALSDYVSEVESENHKFEYEADYFAVRSILASSARRSENLDSKISVEINSFQIGPILAMLGFIYLYGSFEKGSYTHPAWKGRLDACIDFYLKNFQKYGVDYGMSITRIYAVILFGEASKVAASWDSWWQKQPPSWELDPTTDRL